MGFLVTAKLLVNLNAATEYQCKGYAKAIAKINCGVNYLYISIFFWVLGVYLFHVHTIQKLI